MRVDRRKSNTPHQRQEAEANTFAIELLAPRRRLTRYRRGVPDLEAVLAIADAFDLSREASARRYVEVHDEPLAVVFSQNGRVRSTARSRPFPRLAVGRGDLLSNVPDPSDARGLSDVVEGDPRDWLMQPDGVSLSVQVLYQQAGWMLTLLYVEGRDGDDPDGLESLDERLAGRLPDRR